MEQTKLIRSNLGQVSVQFQPFHNRSGQLRAAKSVSMPFSNVDRRQPRMRASQMQQSSSVVCHVGLVCLLLHIYNLYYMSVSAFSPAIG